MSLVHSGESVSLAHDLATEPQPEHPHPVQHHMLASGDARDANGIPGYEAARDHLALDVHGLLTTHVDALSHMFVRGEMYGGRPASEVRSDGALSNTVLSMADGVIGRGRPPRRAPGPRLPLPGERGGGHRRGSRGGRVRPGGHRRARATSCWWPGGGRPVGPPPGASTASRDSTPSACPGCRSGRWPCWGATGSPIPCPSWARRSGPSPSTRSGSPAWASTSSTTWPWPHWVHGVRRSDVGSSSSPWARCASPKGTGMPGQSGGRAVSTPALRLSRPGGAARGRGAR